MESQPKKRRHGGAAPQARRLLSLSLISLAVISVLLGFFIQRRPAREIYLLTATCYYGFLLWYFYTPKQRKNSDIAASRKQTFLKEKYNKKTKKYWPPCHSEAGTCVLRYQSQEVVFPSAPGVYFYDSVHGEEKYSEHDSNVPLLLHDSGEKVVVGAQLLNIVSEENSAERVIYRILCSEAVNRFPHRMRCIVLVHLENEKGELVSQQPLFRLLDSNYCGKKVQISYKLAIVFPEVVDEAAAKPDYIEILPPNSPKAKTRQQE
jgi:Ca2+/Na+ antiporter